MCIHVHRHVPDVKTAESLTANTNYSSATLPAVTRLISYWSLEKCLLECISNFIHVNSLPWSPLFGFLPPKYQI